MNSGTDSTANPSALFEPLRPRLRGLAYRMLGSMADAEDAVQETYMRWHQADRSQVSDPRAFLMTITTRICFDLLNSARNRREEYVGSWLPEPVFDTTALAADANTELAEDLSIALLLTLDRLSPLERAAFLLHDVFDFSFDEIATALDRSAVACRQLATRARKHVRDSRPRGVITTPSPTGDLDAKHKQLLMAFVGAVRQGDVEGLKHLLTSDVRVVADGGGKVRANPVMEGADKVAQAMVQATRPHAGQWWRDDFTMRFAIVNGWPAVIVDAPDGPVQTSAVEFDGDKIRAVYVMRNPDKLRHLAYAHGRPSGTSKSPMGATEPPTSSHTPTKE